MLRLSFCCVLFGLPLWGQVPISWSGLVADPKVPGTIFDSTLYDDGQGEKLYVAGSFEEVGGVPAQGLARFDGTQWEVLAAPINGEVKCLAVHDEGNGERLFLGGSFIGEGTLQGVDHLARFDGANFSGVGGGVNGEVWAMEVWDDGSGEALFVGGRFFSAGGLGIGGLIAKWDGALWSALAGGVTNPGFSNSLPFFGVYDMEVFDPGTREVLVVGGTIDGVGVPPLAVNNVATWDGTNWGALSPFGNFDLDDVRALASFDSGSGPRLFAGGSAMITAAGPAGNVLLEWDGSGWQQPGLGVSPIVGVGPQGELGRVRALEVFDDGNGMALHAGGRIYQTGGVLVDGWGRFDGVQWNQPPGRVYQTLEGRVSVFCFRPLPNSLGGGILVGGEFGSAGVGPHRSLARWSSGGFSSIGGPAGVLQNYGQLFQSLRNIRSYDGAAGQSLVVGGDFDVIGGVASSGLATFNGVSFQALPGGALGGREVEVVNDGTIDTLLALTSDGVFQFQGSAWIPAGPVGNAGSMRTRTGLVTYADFGSGPALYAGGELGAGTVSGNDQVFRFNGTSWVPLPLLYPPFGGSPTSTIFLQRLFAWDDGTGEALFAAFNAPTGFGFTAVAKWDGANWQLLPPVGLGISNYGGAYIRSLATFNDQASASLYVNGVFDLGSGTASNGVLRWTGTAWQAVGAPMQPNTVLLKYAEFDAGDGARVYAMGRDAGTSTLWTLTGTTLQVVATYPDLDVEDMVTHDDGGGTDLYFAARQRSRPGGRFTDIFRSSTCMDSRVGQSAGVPEAVLGVALGSGPAAYPRSVTIPLGQSFSLNLRQPVATTLPADHALALYGGPAVRNVLGAPGLDAICLPFPGVSTSIWLAASGGIIPPLITTPPAPWSYPVIGGLPFPMTLTIQGIIADDSAPFGFARTNGLTLRIQ